MLGKQIRLERLRNRRSGRILTIAVDHAPSYGVLRGLEDICPAVDRLAAAGPEAMVMMKGTAERCFSHCGAAGRVALILKSSTLSPYHPTHDVWVGSVDDALALGADAIAMALTVGSSHQAQLLANLAALVREAERAGLPVIVHAYPNGELVPPGEVYTAARVGYAARLAMELGVDIVKTFYTGSAESFAQVVAMAGPAQVVAAGGPRLETDAEVLTMAFNVVQAGGAGVTFGRNVWQAADPAALIGALQHVLHEGILVEHALGLLDAPQRAG